MYSDTRGREHRSDAAMRGYNFNENALVPMKSISILQRPVFSFSRAPLPQALAGSSKKVATAR